LEQMFSGPIPGESLTREPGNAPWEQPPQLDKVEDVMGFYMDRFERDEVLEGLLDILDKGMAVEHFVDTTLLYGEMEGKHSVDASVIVAPLLHEYIVFLADAAGVKYREFQDDQEPVDKVKQDMMALYDPEEPEEDLNELSMDMPVEEAPTPPKRGLIERRP
jgi:hypothetical protein